MGWLRTDERLLNVQRLTCRVDQRHLLEAQTYWSSQWSVGSRSSLGSSSRLPPESWHLVLGVVVAAARSRSGLRSWGHRSKSRCCWTSWSSIRFRSQSTGSWAFPYHFSLWLLRCSCQVGSRSRIECGTPILYVLALGPQGTADRYPTWSRKQRRESLNQTFGSYSGGWT